MAILGVYRVELSNTSPAAANCSESGHPVKMQGISQVARPIPKTGSRRSTREPVGATRRGIGPIVYRLESRKAMLNQELKDHVVSRILPNVRTPGQYVGGELNSVAKDHRTARGTVCLAFPDTYALGMSHHGLQVLYSLMNAAGWACERAFTPLPDFEDALSEHGLPLYGLETFTPLCRFDVLGLLAPVRDLLHERPDDARPGRDRAPRRGPRAGRHAGDRRRARAPRTPSCSRPSSTCS